MPPVSYTHLDVYKRQGTTSGITVAAGATLTFPYTCTFASKPASAVTNTATATWTAGMPYGTTGTASGTASATFCLLYTSRCV